MAFRALRAAGLAVGLGLTALAAYQRNQAEMDYATRGGHLDATTGREVVFCHACSHEWWKEDHGLHCPRCESDITEIVSPDNDPRLIEDGPSLHETPGAQRHRYPMDDDSDPEEADIEEHLHRGPSGFLLHRAIWDHQRPGQESNTRQTPDPSTRQPPDPGDGDQIIRRFIDMVNDFGMGMPPRPPDETRPPAGFGGGGGLFGGQGNVRTYYRGGPGGTTSFTIATGPIHIHPGGARSPVGPGTDPFQSIFSSVLNGAGPPSPGAAGQGQRPAGGAPTLLHEILNMLNPANASHGDAVYTQEALDRIISTLMEQNPQSNAAPPATDDALSKLERKKVDEKMLGPEGKAECTICIDDFNLGDDATVLPCKHWFHDQCVVMWLKEHNTCPICRTPIEEASSNNNSGNARTPGNNTASDATPGSSGSNQAPAHAHWDDAPPGIPGHWGPPSFPPAFTARPVFFGGPPPVPSDSTRPDRSAATEWDVPFLYGSGAAATGANPSEYPPRPAPSESNRMPSFRSRRDSHSPSSLRRHQSDRARQRSPSSGNWERNQDSNNSQDSGSSHGPLNWLRNTFSRGGGGGGSGDNSRERRRS
ncbi:putative ankyrin repeat protein [Colletotrichum karsti]|uniref:RING-type E3 ubiquitin transferase n=1 Tax=Colletotrichum karsti TaxID=1095194 RepID=A0A9P6LJQ2_9PEZI|nr:putative ankyrin repeat protein [Colletotrichum karsti]KAF9874802.1 putative ankyrin repeat protein [Colletotrichum karsti]